ncbi:DUF423 domain-containing protein [Nibricoccus aquaticus]|nr:DUF423 domain-containing protein [Nibricoccus aquaticus]
MKAAAGILGLTGLALGAFGAHALKSRLSAAGTLTNWETAVHYHLIHAVALLALAAINTLPASRSARWHDRAALSWIIGACCFSGSLYLMALGGPRWLWPVTPLGGLFLLAGWGCLLVREQSSDSADKKI